MNINYDEIITKANERKNALKEFEGAVTHLDDVLNDEGATFQQALQRYKSACDALDAEAHKMLPGRTAYCVANWANNMLSGLVYFSKLSAGYDQTPDQALAKLLES